MPIFPFRSEHFLFSAAENWCFESDTKSKHGTSKDSNVWIIDVVEFVLKFMAEFLMSL